MNRPIWDTIIPFARENSWTVHDSGRWRLEKDGYEIYFMTTGGYELTIRDPETTNRRAVFERRHKNVESPLDVAILLYVISHPEEIVSKYG